MAVFTAVQWEHKREFKSTVAYLIEVPDLYFDVQLCHWFGFYMLYRVIQLHSLFYFKCAKINLPWLYTVIHAV